MGLEMSSLSFMKSKETRRLYLKSIYSYGKSIADQEAGEFWKNLLAFITQLGVSLITMNEGETRRLMEVCPKTLRSRMALALEQEISRSAFEDK